MQLKSITFHSWRQGEQIIAVLVPHTFHYLQLFIPWASLTQNNDRLGCPQSAPKHLVKSGWGWWTLAYILNVFLLLRGLSEVVHSVTTVLNIENDLFRRFIWCCWSTLKFLYCTYYQGYMPLEVWDIPKCSSDLSAQLSFVVEVWCDSNLVFLETYFLHLKMSVTVWSISLDYITVACNTQEIWKTCCIKLPLRKLWYSK